MVRVVREPEILPIEERATSKCPELPVETTIWVLSGLPLEPRVIEMLVVNTLNPDRVMGFVRVVVEARVVAEEGRLL
jgi:hypothetical protein